jgi:hypothetical protein
MAQPTQIAFRTLKGIGILNAAPVYEALAGFDPLVQPGSFVLPILTDMSADLRATFAVAATPPTASTLPGPRLSSKSQSQPSALTVVD